MNKREKQKIENTYRAFIEREGLEDVIHPGITTADGIELTYGDLMEITLASDQFYEAIEQAMFEQNIDLDTLLRASFNIVIDADGQQKRPSRKGPTLH